MALSWNEIKDRALRFSKEWEGETRERAEKDSFLNDFFKVFGKERRSVAVYEKNVKRLGKHAGFIDLFWPGTLIVEHKSAGKDLDAAFEQATDYFHGLKEHEIPKYVLVSDFQRFRLYDLEGDAEYGFTLQDLHKNIKLFGFIAGYQKREFKEEDPVNIAAAELMGKFHDQLEATGYTGHILELYLVRVLFCLFAEDTGIFEKDAFRELIEVKTNEDGSDLGPWITQLFQVLNTKPTARYYSLDEHLRAFPYVNGKLFEEILPMPSFDSEMREMLLKLSNLDWSQISPAIFGSMFQSVMEPQERRNLGAHYTSEKNIMKLIKPLFLDELWEEFEKIKSNKNRLREFHQKISELKFLDGAAGCGNFLIVTYKHLRLLELEILKILINPDQLVTSVDIQSIVNVDQFYGIEIDEFPARIAEVAMWLVDHQMNMLVSEQFGLYYARLPLKKSANIVNDNALRLDWAQVVDNKELSYIIGNPPFIGHHLQTEEQKNDMTNILDDIKAKGVLDYVSAWFYKSSKFIQNTNIQVGLVSTNSISQGEQVSILWDKLINKFKIKINFAHRTFKWNNEAKGKAAVHVVIIGFACKEKAKKYLFDYVDINSDPVVKEVTNINPFLVDAPSILLHNKSNPICDVPNMKYGSKPTDGGYFLLTDDEKDFIISNNPNSKSVIKRFISGKEFLRNTNRYCIWLDGVSPQELKKMPLILDRVKSVQDFRSRSKAKQTRDYPYHQLFRQITQPDSDYLIVPRTTSERRKYIPLAFYTQNDIVSDTCQSIPGATIYHFGVLTSEMHMAWVKYTCGRLESRYRYSKDIVYNNYPWPLDPTEKQKEKVELAAQKVLDLREEFPDSSLADLYDPLTMPPKLLKAHQELDKAVDQCYRKKAFNSETERIEFLFDLYSQYTSGMFQEEKPKKKKRGRK